MKQLMMSVLMLMSGCVTGPEQLRCQVWCNTLLPENGFDQVMSRDERCWDDPSCDRVCSCWGKPVMQLKGKFGPFPADSVYYVKYRGIPAPVQAPIPCGR